MHRKSRVVGAHFHIRPTYLSCGPGRPPTLDQIAEIHGHLRRLLEERVAGQGIRLLYGGSLKPSNARDILALKNVDGALVGGASLAVDDFWAICRSCPD